MRSKIILVVDDEHSMRVALSETLSSCGYVAKTAENGVAAMSMFKADHYDMVITDLRMPQMGGLDLLREVKKTSPKTPVIVITAYGTVNTAVEAMKEGASEFIMKPFSQEDLELAVKNVLSQTQVEREGPTSQTDPYANLEIVTKNEQMLAILELLRTVAKSKCSILIQGESGTGKELLARYVYRHSSRKKMPFVAINCAAIPSNLLESEMFGYEKGAFTGATQRKPGKFELASGGTMFLDEIGEMDINLQAKLLRVLQEGEVDRLGGKEPFPVDVRIIATTNADLKRSVENKTFRADLYYRLNVIPVKAPPLRERREDIDLLCDYFLHKYCLENNKTGLICSKEAGLLLNSGNWPGNIRELENTIERAVLICRGNIIKPEHLYPDMSEMPVREDSADRCAGEADDRVTDKPKTDLSLTGADSTLWEMEKNLIYETLKKVGGNKTRASKLLGISVRTMRNKLHEYEQKGFNY